MRTPLIISLLVHSAAVVALGFHYVGALAADEPMVSVSLSSVETPHVEEPPPPLPEPVFAEAAQPAPVPEPEAAPVEWPEAERVADVPPTARPLRFARLARPLPRRAEPAPAPAPPPQVRTVQPRKPTLHPPRLVRERSARPTYPPLARRLGLEGEVVLRVNVGADGSVTDAKVERSSGHESLDRAAVAAVSGYRYRPARRGDRAVATTIRVPIHFALRPASRGS